MCKENTIPANNAKIPVEGPTAIQTQLQELTSEITVEFLVTKNEITPCSLSMEFLYKFNSNLYTRRKRTLLRGNLVTN